jgi:hypothetical protein
MKEDVNWTTRLYSVCGLCDDELASQLELAYGIGFRFRFDLPVIGARLRLHQCARSVSSSLHMSLARSTSSPALSLHRPTV